MPTGSRDASPTDLEFEGYELAPVPALGALGEDEEEEEEEGEGFKCVQLAS